MGARAQHILYDDADRLTLLSNKQSDNDAVSSFAYVLNRTGIGCARRRRRKKQNVPFPSGKKPGTMMSPFHVFAEYSYEFTDKEVATDCNLRWFEYSNLPTKSRREGYPRLPENEWYDVMALADAADFRPYQDWSKRETQTGKRSKAPLYDAPFLHYWTPISKHQYTFFTVVLDSSTDPVCKQVCQWKSVALTFMVNNYVSEGVNKPGSGVELVGLLLGPSAGTIQWLSPRVDYQPW